MNPNHIYKPGSAAAVNGAASPGDDCEEKISSFPLEHLPPAARAMAGTVARVARTPEPLAACCVLAVLSASIGAGLQVPSQPDKIARGNLYFLVGMKSGMGKSETFRPVVEPFFAYERDMVEHWQAEVLPGLEAEADLLKKEIETLVKKLGKGKSGMEREELRRELAAKKKAMKETTDGIANPPRLCCEDVTSQQLAAMLQQNQEQLASLSPDAGSIVNILLGQYSKLDRTDDNIYLKAWSGDNCRVDRKGSGPILLQRPCLAALWLVQPDKIETLLAERSLTDGGLIPRPLMCQPNAQHRPIVRGAEGIPAATVNAWALLVGKLIKTFRFASEPVTIEPAPEVLQLMDAHCNRIVERMKTDLQDVDSYAARWNEQAWRIAVVLHAGLHGENAGEQTMAADTAASAIALADWFAGEQLRILERGRHAARRAKRDEVLALLAVKPQGIRASGVYRARIVDSADEAHALLAKMEADGELTHTESKPEGGGHVTLIYTTART
jgi:hypothetical protein